MRLLQRDTYGAVLQYAFNETTAMDGVDGRMQNGGQMVAQRVETGCGFGRGQFTCRGSVQAETPATTSNSRRSWLTTWAASGLAHR